MGFRAVVAARLFQFSIGDFRFQLMDSREQCANSTDFAQCSRDTVHLKWKMIVPGMRLASQIETGDALAQRGVF